MYQVVYHPPGRYWGQVPSLFFCGSEDLGQLSPSSLPLTLSLFFILFSSAPPCTMMKGLSFLWGSLQRKGFITLLFILSPILSASRGTNKRGCSLGYPRFLLLLLLLAEARRSFALICPKSSAITGRGRLSWSVIVAGDNNTLAPTWEVWSQSMSSVRPLSHKQYGSVQATRKLEHMGNPRFCSVWWGVTF